MFCLGVLTYNVVLQAFEHGHKKICFVLSSNVHDAFVLLLCLFVCVFVCLLLLIFFLHLYCSAPLSMFN